MAAPRTVAAVATAAAAALSMLLVLQVVPQAAALSAGEVFRVCRRSDPQLGDCIKRSVQEFVPKLAKGVPELKIVPHDPMKLVKLSIRQGQGPASIDFSLTNQSINGMGNAEILSAKVDLEKNEIMLEFKTPYLFAAGHYSIDVRILVVPIKGQGFGRTNYTGVTGTVVLRGHREKRGGKEFLEPDALVVDLHVEKATILLENLFGGDKLLGETMARLLNENWELVFNEMKPAVDEAIGLLLNDPAQHIFRRFPLDELLPQ